MTQEDLRIVFMGTPEIATASLDAIHKKGYNIVGVITAPDRPAGRGRKIQYSHVKQYALEKRLHLMQPTNLKDPAFQQALKDLQPDVQVVVAFRMLPEAVWALPPKGTFNLHASILPQYRGAAPINWAVINGETQTGVTTFFLDKEIDTGRIIAREKVEIHPEDTAGTLHDRLKDIGAELVVNTLEKITGDQVESIPQEQLTDQQRPLSKAPKIFKEDCRIQWDKPAEEINNLIRGLNPVPGAFAELELENRDTLWMKIFEAYPIKEKHDYHPGMLFTDDKNYIKISTQDGFIEVKTLQVSGKKRMKTSDFLRGFSFNLNKDRK